MLDKKPFFQWENIRKLLNGETYSSWNFEEGMVILAQQCIPHKNSDIPHIVVDFPQTFTTQLPLVKECIQPFGYEC